jgi:hypothetical protein
VDDFGLSDDRAKFIEDLAPGSNERFYYRALNHQLRGELDKVEKVFKEWENPGSGYSELFRRQSLLRWNDDFSRSQSYVRRELGLRFDHEREVEDEADRYPSALDSDALSWKALSNYIVSRGNLDDLSPLGRDRAAREAVAGEGPDTILSGDRLRTLLRTLPHADHEHVATWILQDLDHEPKRGFGYIPLHSLLTLAQLEELAELRPALLQDSSFVEQILRRLRPDGDLDDPAVRAPYLERLLTFVGRLGDGFLALRLEILNHRLRLGGVDMAQLREYLAIPRHAGYINSDWLRDHDTSRRAISFGNRHGTGLEPVRNDEELVKELLEELLASVSGVEDPAVVALQDTLDARYLKRRLATAKLLAGAPDPDRWAALLDDSSELARLRERVELRLRPENVTRYGRDDAVTLEVDTKRVDELTVKVFRLEVENVFHSSGAEPGLGIDLDGLVPQAELRFSYDEPPIQRVRRSFELPQLAGPGLYVVDFIGAGVNSRALIRKGELRLISRPSAAGQAIWAVDELGRGVASASLHMGERVYQGDEGGRILIPFSTSSGPRATIIRAGELVSIQTLNHLPEAFELSAQLHVDREQLVAGNQATVLVRALLTTHGAPASLELLSEVKLETVTTDLRGIEAASETALTLSEAAEATHGFRVPEDCARVALRLSAKLERKHQSPLELSSSRSYAINAIDQSSSIRSLYLEHSAEGYRIEVRGKNGELCPHVVVRIGAQHRGLASPKHRTLQANAAGTITLGALDEIRWLEADLEGAPTARWELSGPRAQALPSHVNAIAGEVLELPWPGERTFTRQDFALFGLRAEGGRPSEDRTQDRFDAISVAEGLLRIEGLKPGWYRLYFKGSARYHQIFVADGHRIDRFAISAVEAAELRYRKPPGLVVREEADGLRVSIRNSSERTRVHVFGTRFVPEHDALIELGHDTLRAPSRSLFRTRPSAYESGRVLGEEVRYVLDRQAAEAIPGNLLERPALILNPWSLRTTTTQVRDARGGASFLASALGGAVAASAPPPAPRRGPGGGGGGGVYESAFPTWDFLPETSVQLLNLRPDAEGQLTIPRADLGPVRCVRILVCDAQLAAEERVTLGRTELEPKDRRLWLGLEPEGSFAEQRLVQTLQQGQELAVADLTTAKLARYDSLDAVYRLQGTLNPSEAHTTFGFLTRWPSLSAAEQERLYSEHACHELHLFLYFKDRAFFDRVVEPYLRHKRVRTFVDRWLLNEDLSEFCRPWAYGRLNAAERVLLGRRLPEQRAAVARHLAELSEGDRLDHGARARLFDAAIQSQDHGEDDLGIEEARSEAKRDKVREAKAGSRRRSAAKPKAKKKMAMEKSMAFDDDDEGMAFEECEAEPEMERSLGMDDEWGDVAGDAALRQDAPQLFRGADKTQELAENDYYKVRPDHLRPDRVPAGPFWVDLANHSGDEPFLSQHVATANSSFTEQALALAFLGLPFSAPAPEVSFEAGGMRLVPASPQVVYLQELRPAPRHEDAIQILVGQRIVRADEDDDEDDDDDEETPTPRSDELLVRVVYTCQVVVSNPGDRERKLELLLQIPRGALPVEGCRRTESRALELGGFETESVEYSFYFPEPGEFEHLPVQVAYREAVVASPPARILSVVAEPSQVDTTSWSYISQRGSLDEVLAYMEQANLERLDLSRIAWRMAEEPAFLRVIELLQARHVFDRAIYGYGVHHHHDASARELLLHEESFLRSAGPLLDSPIVSIDPIARGWYFHKEYDPLLNARAHQLGSDREILNNGLREQWAAFQGLTKFRPQLTPDDRLALVYYLLVQDRIGEALDHFGRVPRDQTRCQLQHDYLGAYLAVSRGEPGQARALAEPYQEHPVRRWRDRFRSVLAMVDELATGRVAEAGGPERTARQTELASQEPSFSLQVEGAKLHLQAQHVESLVLRYYRMDLELLFSLQPFGWTDSGRFAYTAPHLTQELGLGADEDRVLSLPQELEGQNVVVEARAAGQREVVTVYAHSLVVRVMERFGQLQVSHAQGGALGAVYVKVYARQKSGAVQFYKDGYTDLRGRFDHATLSTDQLDHVERFSILIASREHGALVREAAPPAR